VTNEALLYKFFGRGAFLGLKLWAVAGFFWGVFISDRHVLSMLLCGAVCIPLGAMLGVLFGGINGLILGAVTIAFYSTEDRLANYKPVMIGVSVGVSLIACLLFYGFTLRVSLDGDVDPLPILLFGVMAAAINGLMGIRTANWYLGLRQEESSLYEE
jgi:hypothetical protein